MPAVRGSSLSAPRLVTSLPSAARLPSLPVAVGQRAPPSDGARHGRRGRRSRPRASPPASPSPAQQRRELARGFALALAQALRPRCLRLRRRDRYVDGSKIDAHAGRAIATCVPRRRPRRPDAAARAPGAGAAILPPGRGDPAATRARQPRRGTHARPTRRRRHHLCVDWLRDGATRRARHAAAPGGGRPPAAALGERARLVRGPAGRAAQRPRHGPAPDARRAATPTRHVAARARTPTPRARSGAGGAPATIAAWLDTPRQRALAAAITRASRPRRRRSRPLARGRGRGVEPRSRRTQCRRTQQRAPSRSPADRRRRPAPLRSARARAAAGQRRRRARRRAPALPRRHLRPRCEPRRRPAHRRRSTSSGERSRFAVAAYNAGQGRVARAQEQAAALRRDPTRYESIRSFLPRITQRYVDRVMRYSGRADAGRTHGLGRSDRGDAIRRPGGEDDDDATRGRC